MFSVVIPNLHSPIVDQVVAALDRQTARDAIAEIIVVGQDRYRRVPSHVSFIATPRPVSVNAARNIGARHACGTYVLLLDADCIAAPDLVERLLARHRAGHHVVGGGLAPEFGNYWVLVDNLVTFGSSLAFLPPGARNYVPGFVMSIERTALFAAGAFDERFAGADGGDDQEFCYRMARRGYSLFFEPQASVFHRPQRASAAAVWDHLQRYGRQHLLVQRAHTDVAQSRIGPWLAPLAPLLLALAPLLALADTLLQFAAIPGLRRYWPALPGMIWARTAWYWGIAQALLCVPNPQRKQRA
jgi:glycosyltransferase involved in cell wall biosynthesis